MAFNTILQQGSFTATGDAQRIAIRSDVDWMTVYNENNIIATADNSTEFYWQRGMDDGTGFRKFKSGGADTLNQGALVAPAGFTPINTSLNPNGARIATTAVTNATQPLVSTANTIGLANGDIVRLDSTANVPDLNGIDFEIDTIVPGVSFNMAATLANGPGVAGGAGFYRKINFDKMFYPRNRFIVNITQPGADVLEITTSVSHGMTVGQDIRFVIPANFSMIELDGLRAAVNLVVDKYTFQVQTPGANAFTAFDFINAAQAANAFNWAQMVPFGEDPEVTLALGGLPLADATINTALIGMLLPGGQDSPGGANGDTMYWVAGKSFSVTNTL